MQAKAAAERRATRPSNRARERGRQRSNQLDGSPEWYSWMLGRAAPVARLMARERGKQPLLPGAARAAQS